MTVIRDKKKCMISHRYISCIIFNQKRMKMFWQAYFKACKNRAIKDYTNEVRKSLNNSEL